MIRRCRSLLTSLSLLVLTGLFPQPLSAQVPHDMAYQGVLTDAVGAPLTRPVTLVFRVFDLPSGGTPLYTETHSDVAIDPMDGSFLVQLGLGTTDLDTDGDGAAETNPHAFDASLFESGPNRYLEIQVGSGVSGEILAPRQMIGSVPYALVAADVVTDPASSTVGLHLANIQGVAENNAASIATTSTTLVGLGESLAELANDVSALEGGGTVGSLPAELQIYLASLCGNANVEAGIESCDDGNAVDDANGCSAICQLNSVCGNSAIEDQAESCDDGNAINGDGCDDSCAIEPGYSCTGSPSTCSELRFVACRDGLTVSDRETGLMWERKDAGSGSIHDFTRIFTYSSSSGPPDGTLFTEFLAGINQGDGFAGFSDWRLPSISEMQSISVGLGVLVQSTNVSPEDPQMGLNVTGQPAICDSFPCVDPAFSLLAGPTVDIFDTPHWTSSLGQDPAGVWVMFLSYETLNTSLIDLSFVTPFYGTARAVRSGSCLP